MSFFIVALNAICAWLFHLPCGWAGLALDNAVSWRIVRVLPEWGFCPLMSFPFSFHGGLSRYD